MGAHDFPGHRFTKMPPRQHDGKHVWTWGWTKNERCVPMPDMGFYITKQVDAKSIFSLNHEVKIPRSLNLDKFVDRDPVAWNNAQIEQEARLIRYRFPEEAKMVLRPSSWDYLYLYFDAHDLWFKGAWNLWCVIDLLGEQNTSTGTDNNNNNNQTTVNSKIHGARSTPAIVVSSHPNAVSTASNSIVADAAVAPSRKLTAAQFQIINHWAHQWLTDPTNCHKIEIWDHSFDILLELWPEDWHDIHSPEHPLQQEGLDYLRDYFTWHHSKGCQHDKKKSALPDYMVNINAVQVWTGYRSHQEQNGVADGALNNPNGPETEPCPRPTCAAGITQRSPAGAVIADGTKKRPASKDGTTTQDGVATTKEMKETKRHHHASKSSPVIPIPVDPELVNRRDGVEKSGPSRLPSRSLQPPVDGNSIAIQKPAAPVDAEHLNNAQQPVASKKPAESLDSVSLLVPCHPEQPLQTNTSAISRANLPIQGSYRRGLHQGHQSFSYCKNYDRGRRGPFEECPCFRCTQASRSVIVRGLDNHNKLTTTQKRDIIGNFFCQWGDVDRCEIHRSVNSRNDYAIVRFLTEECAKAAIHAAQDIPLMPLSTRLFTWYPSFHKGWREYSESPTSRGSTESGRQFRPFHTGSPGRQHHRSSPPYANNIPPSAGNKYPHRVSPGSSQVQVPGYLQHPRMGTRDVHAHSVGFAPPHTGYYGEPLSMDVMQGYGGTPPPPGSFFWQYPQFSSVTAANYPPPMSAPMSGHTQGPTFMQPQAHPQTQPTTLNLPSTDRVEPAESKESLEEFPSAHSVSRASPSSSDGSIRVRLPSMSPEKKATSDEKLKMIEDKSNASNTAPLAPSDGQEKPSEPASTPPTTPRKKNKKIIKRKNAAKKRRKQASAAAVPGAEP